MTSPYQILGIPESSSVEDAKKAFKNLAKKYHPDVNKEPDAEQKFKEINAAYQQIINPSVEEPEFSVDIDEMINSIFGRKFKRPIRIAVNVTLKEAHLGCNKMINIGGTLQDITIPPGVYHGDQYAFNHDGHEYVMVVQITLPDNFAVHHGNLVLVHRLSAKEFAELNTITIENHLGKSFNVSIEKNLDTDKLLRIPEAGFRNQKSSKDGDLLIKLTIYK